jgi:transcription initiation factor TFIIB
MLLNKIALMRNIEDPLVWYRTTIYVACRELETPKRLKDIIGVSNITRRDTTRNYRQLILELDLKIPVVDPMKCIARVANRAHLSEMAKHQGTG